MWRSFIKRTLVEFALGILGCIIGYLFLVLFVLISFRAGFSLGSDGSMGPIILMLMFASPIGSIAGITGANRLFFVAHKIALARFIIGAIFGFVGGCLSIYLACLFLGEEEKWIVLVIFLSSVVMSSSVGYHLPELIKGSNKSRKNKWCGNGNPASSFDYAATGHR